MLIVLMMLMVKQNSIQTSPDSNESILSPDDDHVRDPTYIPRNNDIHGPIIINHRDDDATAIATRAAAAAARPIPPQVLAGQFRRAAIANQLYPLQQQQQQQPLPQLAAAVAAPAVGAAPAPAPRRRRRALQRIRARPIPGHNFYDSHFIRALPNITPAKRKSLLQAAIPNRKASVLKYYRENNYPIPAMMNSPNPGYAPVIPGSPADSIEDFEQPPLRRIRRRRQQPAAAPAAAPVAIPFPQIPNIDDVDDLSPLPPTPPPRPAPAPIAAPMINQQQRPMTPGSIEEEALFRNRDEINRQRNLRHILDTYCASDKSRADLRAFNRDYLACISDICNNAL